MVPTPPPHHAEAHRANAKEEQLQLFGRIMVETDGPRPASTSSNAIYFVWQLTELIARVVENLSKEELKLVAPGLLEKNSTLQNAQQ